MQEAQALELPVDRGPPSWAHRILIPYDKLRAASGLGVSEKVGLAAKRRKPQCLSTADWNQLEKSGP